MAYSDPEEPATYGWNNLISGKRMSLFQHPAATVMAQDAPEHRLEGGDGNWNDTLSAWGGPINFPQWRDHATTYFYIDAEHEFYRHSGLCNVLWMDGHVSGIGKSDGHDVPKEWYTGQ